MKKLKQLKNRGKFIVMYGSNNVGKSTQIERLVKRLVKEGRGFLNVKYPIYGLKPTGPRLDRIIRLKDAKLQDISEKNLQILFAQNRRDFQPLLIDLLNNNINIVAEDYIGTGVAWGATRDLKIVELEKINKSLVKPDLALLLDGERKVSGIEKKHRNEGKGSNLWEEDRQFRMFYSSDDVWEKNRRVHLKLAKRYGWKIINVDRDADSISGDVWNKVSRILES